jgi:predicted nucleic acid-binding protein
MPRPSVYIETSIISYLAARRSRELIVAAQQQTTHEWWEAHRGRFDPVVSEVVIREAEAGDSRAARRRLGFLDGVRTVPLSDASEALARALLIEAGLPRKAALDAAHVAAAACNGVNYLLTWNCRHIANAVLRPRLESACRGAGFEPPIICTPYELL